MASGPGNQARVSDVTIDPAQSDILKQAAHEIQVILDKYGLTMIPVAHIQLIPRPTEDEG
jgi:hypothetical protein